MFKIEMEIFGGSIYLLTKFLMSIVITSSPLRLQSNPTVSESQFLTKRSDFVFTVLIQSFVIECVIDRFPNLSFLSSNLTPSSVYVPKVTAIDT